MNRELRAQSLSFARKFLWDGALLVMFFFWILALPGSRTGAAESNAEVAHGANFRRIFVPLDSPAEWPIGKEQYLPILKSEFTHLINEKSERQAGNASTLLHLAGGTYYAELIEGQVLVGRAELLVQTSSKRPRFLSLSPWNMTLTSAYWNHDDSHQAEIGIWQRTANLHDLGILVRRSDTLHLAWQLRAFASGSSSMNFLLKAPVAVPQVLALLLPENHTAVLKSGELFRTEEMSDGKTRYWFQLAPTESHRLRVLRPSKKSSKKSLPLIARTTSYHLNPEGLSFLTSLRFSAYGRSSGDLDFDISGGTKVVSVDINQEGASWRIDENSDGQRLVVERKSSRLPFLVEIRCIAPMQFDQTWRLPRLRPQEVSWTEGTARLVVSPKLELRSIVPRQASLQQIEGLSRQQPAEEVVHVREWSEDARLEVVVGRRSLRLQVRSATTIDIDPQDSEKSGTSPNESTAQTIAELSCQGRPSYQIEAEVSPDWSIEAIQSDPSSALGQWHVLEDENRKLLRIQLNEPILPGSPLRLEIDSSLQKAGSLLPTSARELSPLRFLSERHVRRLLLLRSRQRGQMELLHGLDHSRLATEAIGANDVALLPDLGDGVLLDLAHIDEEALVELQSRSDRYHAEVHVDVQVLPNSLDHDYRLDCSPISGVVSEVLVQFDQPLPDAAQWELVGHRGGVVATLVDQVVGETDRPDAPVTYHLQLPMVVEGPFRLRTQTSIPATETQACNLLSLPEAPDWRGQVVVHGPLEGVAVDDRLWTPLAQQKTEIDQQPRMPVLGCYRLGAHQTKQESQTRSLLIRRTATQLVDANLFAWVADLQSFHAADGTTIYRATYLLENSGSTGADIQLPPQAHLQHAWLDQEHFEPREVLADEGKCRFHFDRDRRYPALAVQYVIRGPTLQHTTTLEPPLPECSFPIHQGRWTLWMSEQYVVGGVPGGSANPLSWTERLCGPLARAAGQPVFNPFRVDSWLPRWSAPLDQQGPVPRAALSADSMSVDVQVNLAQVNSAQVDSPTPRDPPWRTHDSTLFAGIGHRGATVEFVGGPPPMVIIRKSVQRAQWHVIWLLALILSTWLFARHADKLVLLLGFSAAICLVISPEWLSGFQAISLGLLSAFFLQIPLKKLAWNVPEHPSTQLATRAAALAILLGAVFLCSRASAESKEVSSGEATTTKTVRSHLYRVLFPVDSKGNPQGKDVYLPEPFLQELRKTSEDSAHDGAQWALVSAVYRGDLPWDPRSTMGEETDAKEAWTITLEAQSFVSNCEIELPFRRDEAQWLKDAHRLDGFPVEVIWNQDGIGCRVHLGATGTHRLELRIKPKITMTSNRARFQMHVPPLPHSRMDFSVPAEISDLKINSAGRILVDPTTGRWQAPLSVADRLQMSWTPPQSWSSPQHGRESDSIGQVEPLAWLHIGPSAVRLDVQLQVEHPREISETLILEVDPQLKLLPLSEASSIDVVERVPAIAPQSESPTLLKLKLKSGLGTKTVLSLQFELPRSDSLGRIFYPQIRVPGATTTRSLFAVSVSQGLSYEESLDEDVRSIESSQFASRWGSTNESPLYAYSQPHRFPKGSLRVWPAPRSISVQQSMRVHCERKHVHVEYEAAVDEIVGSWLTHRLWIPAKFTIEDVSVSRRPEMDQVAVRWSRVHKSQVALFLEQPLQGPHVILIRGHLEISREGELTLPPMSLVDNERREIHVDLTREADVLVRWADRDQVPSSATAKNMVRGRTKIPVSRWTWRASGPKDVETFQIEKNDPQFAADTLTTIAQGASGWTATLHSAIHVQKGVLSQVTLAVPNGFRPPYRIEPAGLGFEDEVRETVSGRQITFLLSKPIAARELLEMHISGELDLPPNQRLEVPDLRLLGSTRNDQYLLLPTRVGQQHVEWNLIGLKSKTLPKHLIPFSSSQENSGVFFVEEPQFFAQELSYQGPLQKADLRYAFISGTLDRAGNLSATAELVLQPGRATHCTLRLPAGARLQQLVTGESRARRESLDDRSWRIPLGPPFLPRKIKIVYQVAAPMTRQSVQLAPPEILIGDRPLPLPQTLWQIRSAGSLRLGETLVGRPLLAEQFARSAHQLPLETLSDSRLLALELPIAEGRSWFQPWQRDTQLAWDGWRAHEPSASASPTRLGSSPSAAAQSSVWSALMSKLGDSKTPNERQATRSGYPPALPTGPYARTPNSLVGEAENHFMSDPQGQLVLAVESVTGVKLTMWFLAAAVAAGSFALVRHLKTQPDWQVHFCNGPHRAAIVGGLLWWLFLAPSVAGLLIVLIALLSLALRRGRKARRGLALGAS
ncbi:MAG: hypothetical protein GXP28_07495 [Planctomycetes bacterium]|nr:hypothetical protein [Planctomycetota bacterium]